MKSSLSLRDALLALAVMAVWGSNFVVIKIALAVMPPLLLAALRFIIVLLPAVFFLKRPAVPWSNLALYGVAIGLFQFGILFIAMNGYISPGLASLVIQMQVFFTIALSMIRQHERVAPHQVAAFLLALAGMGVIAAHNGRGATVAGLGLTLIAALGWAVANQASREAARMHAQVNMLAYVVWSSLFSVPPLLALSLLFEGWPAIAAWPRPCHRRHLGGGGMAKRRQYHVRLCRVGMATGALSRRYRVAAVAVGAGVRHERLGLVSR